MAEKTVLSTEPRASLARHVFFDVLARVGGLARALRHRGEVRRLAELDERALKDIGLTRLEVIGALAEPLYTDPSAILVVRSVERRSRSRTMAVTVRPAGSQSVKAACAV